MMNVKIISLVSVLILFSGMSAVVFGAVSDGADSTTAAADGTGDAEPVKYIVALGYAPALTVAMLGDIDKIIAVETYATYEYTKDERLKDLNAVNLGSIYSASNNDHVVTWLLQWAEDNNVDKDEIGIILTGYSNALVLGDLLREKGGFNNVLAYGNITEWNDILKCVGEISVMSTGEVSSILKDMELVKETVDEGLTGITEKAKGLAVWYSITTGEYQVNNRGSISVSLIEAAGGINVAYDPDKGTRYGDKSTILQMIEGNRNSDGGSDLVIFLSNQTEKTFREDVIPGYDVKVIEVHSNWNNYDPDAADGLWAFACALYPGLFEGKAPKTEDSTSDSNIMLYAAAGLVVVLIVLGATYFIMRRP